MIRVNIYLVCTGNTCRSPLAEAILRARNIESIEVRSAGIHAITGMSISEHARTLIEKEGMPYTETSNRVTEADAEWADYILTMTNSHKQLMRMMFPDESNKIYTLKEFANDGDKNDVHDPFGGELATYEKTFLELSTLMEKAEARLLGGRT